MWLVTQKNSHTKKQRIGEGCVNVMFSRGLCDYNAREMVVWKIPMWHHCVNPMYVKGLCECIACGRVVWIQCIGKVCVNVLHGKWLCESNVWESFVWMYRMWKGHMNPMYRKGLCECSVWECCVNSIYRNFGKFCVNVSRERFVWIQFMWNSCVNAIRARVVWIWHGLWSVCKDFKWCIMDTTMNMQLEFMSWSKKKIAVFALYLKIY